MLPLLAVNTSAGAYHVGQVVGLVFVIILAIAVVRSRHGTVLSVVAVVVAGAVLVVGIKDMLANGSTQPWSTREGVNVRAGFIGGCSHDEASRAATCECVFSHISSAPPYDTPRGFEGLAATILRFQRTGDVRVLPATVLSAAHSCGSAAARAGAPIPVAHAQSRATAPAEKPTSSATVTRNQARAYARAVNLKSADVPGMPMSHTEREFSEEVAGNDRPCSGALPFSPPVAEVESAVFKGGAALKREGILVSIGSTVIVMPSPALAALRVRREAAWHECQLREWQRTIPNRSTNTVIYGAVTGGPLAISLPGTAGSYGWRTVLTASNRETGARRDRYIDGYEFASGRAAIRLLVIMVPQAFPQRTERLLLSSLASRARAAARGS